MLILLSPAKTLDFETPAPIADFNQPDLLDQAAQLIAELKKLTPKDVSALMKISDKLGLLNFERFQDWQTPFTPKNSKQAIYAFKGDVYTGFNVESLRRDDLLFADQHIRILSGLYGVLRPLDLMQAYRLEMGTRFVNSKGRDLYQFWGDAITEHLNQDLQAADTPEVVINLASNEYFKSVQPKALAAKLITPQFKDFSKGKYKVISFYAKKVRGMMSRWIVQNQITDHRKLSEFNEKDYVYCKEESTFNIPVFKRNQS